MTVRTFGSAAVLAAALVGCAQQEEVGQVRDVPSPRPTASDLAVPPPPAGKERVLRGTVALGVEQGCVLLQAPEGEFLLLGGDRALLVPGTALEVTGRADPGLLTTCQQGVPFEVSRIVAVAP